MGDLVTDPLPVHFLAPGHRRAAAARLIDEHSGGYVTDGRFVADTLDATVAAVLRTAGVPDVAARQVLDELWGDR